MKKVIFSMIAIALYLLSPLAIMAQALNDEDKKALIFLREEEKLARDVYRYAHKKYQLQIFSNISESEQHHMDQVLGLLNKYSIEDPILTEEGKFSNHELQLLYQELIAKVDISEESALEVGASIEDLDLKDLKAAKEQTSQQDLQQLYTQLIRASENHMRAFYRNLQQKGKDYQPAYITQENLNQILSETHQQCGGHKGKGNHCKGKKNKCAGGCKH